MLLLAPFGRSAAISAFPESGPKYHELVGFDKLVKQSLSMSAILEILRRVFETHLVFKNFQDGIKRLAPRKVYTANLVIWPGLILQIM